MMPTRTRVGTTRSISRAANDALEVEHDPLGSELRTRHAGNPVIRDAVRVIDELIADARGLGRIRLREHPLCPADANADWLAAELRRLVEA